MVAISNGPPAVVEAAAQAPGVEANIKKIAGVAPTTPATFYINNPRGTNLLELKVEAKDGATATKLSNALAQYLVRRKYAITLHAAPKVQIVMWAQVPIQPQN